MYDLCKLAGGGREPPATRLAPTFFPLRRKVAVVDSTQTYDKDTAARMIGKFNALDHGLYRDFRTDGVAIAGGMLINTRAWNAVASRSQAIGEQRRAVGDCRKCGHEMYALPTHTAGAITWYEAQCSYKPCDAIIASPNGECLRRSGRWSEQPAGFMAGRSKKQAF